MAFEMKTGRERKRYRFPNIEYFSPKDTWSMTGRFVFKQNTTTMKKSLIMLYSIVCYLLGLLIILYNIDFFVGLFVPKSVNSGEPIDPGLAVPLNIILLTLFSLQHSLMARKGFKEWFARRLPAAVSRSTYILFSAIVLGMVFWLWQPIPAVIFDVSGTLAGKFLWFLYACGWLIGILSTFQIDHFDLFGLKQAVDYLKGKNPEQYKFVTPLFYRFVRHPIYLGWILIHWATPYMTVGRFLFATVITVYIYVAVYFEERDLIREFGERYRKYREKTPKLFPVLIPKTLPALRLKKVLIRMVTGLMILIGIFFGTAYLKINSEFRKLENDNPTVWEPVIEELEQDQAALSDTVDLVLFAGSSSIRFWFSLEEDMKPYPVLKKGFGGSKIPDLTYYADRIITPYNPAAVVLFAGTNDICGKKNDKTPDELAAHFNQLILKIRRKLPETDIYYISITPTVERWHVWPQVRTANKLIKEICLSNEKSHFIDMTKHFLDENGQPDRSLFWWDGVHLNGKGYAIWEKEIKSALRKGSLPLSRKIEYAGLSRID
jgi:methanethiol S-methyltransferase